MLETKIYALHEIAVELDMSPNRQGIIRRLQRANIKYSVTGRGQNATFKIKEIPAISAFKLICKKELNFAYNSDFNKIRNLFYFFFNDEEFAALPIEAKVERMDACEKHISSGTISAYLNKLYSFDDSYSRNADYIYYFALGSERRMTNKEEYLKAWHDYWSWRELYNSYIASMLVKEEYKGFPRRSGVPILSAFPSDTILKLIKLTNESYDEEFA